MEKEAKAEEEEKDNEMNKRQQQMKDSMCVFSSP